MSNTADLTVTARDAFGNLISGAVVVLSATGTGNTVTQPVSYTDTIGVTSGSFRSSVAESKVISASINGVWITQTAYVTVQVVATKLGLTVDTLSTVSSSVTMSTQPVIQLLDSLNQPFSQSGIIITASLSGSGTLHGYPWATTDVNGTATFTDLSIGGTMGGLYRYINFDAPNLTRVTSSPITLDHGTAYKIFMDTYPTAGQSGGGLLTPTSNVQIQDVDSNDVDEAGHSISVTMPSGQGGGSNWLYTIPPGTNGVAPKTTDANGRVSWTGTTGLRIACNVGTRYIVFASSGLVSRTVSGINIVS